ncbi:MAG: isoaspartyl peptidase/L-asparaginase [Deltaproteobacteria bacterium]|nr:isoaspartyl peptidase/L-asparaginase [Deltaproteobacteria bacterium]
MKTPSVLVHGGAGAMRGMTPERETRYRDGLRSAASAGRAILEAGGSAMDAAIAAVVDMENGGTFNAGLGSCLTSAGTVEMDAAVMRGSDRGIGAVASITSVANPVELSRAVMDRTPHCMLAADGALAFAREQGFALRENFPPPSRLAEWEGKRARLKARAAGKTLEQGLAELGGVLGDQEDEVRHDPVGDDHDTVGAVAFDSAGGVAAAVSTGGIWLKMPGRVGDSPLPGAGFWAVDAAGASVATGTGESLMRVMICKHVIDRIESHGDPERACQEAVELLEKHFGPNQGGVIAVGPRGGLGWAINTNGMGRSMWRGGMKDAAVAVWPDEDWDRAR